MRVILLDKIKNLGSVGEEVEVKSGYARNFLIPTAKAILASEENIASFESRRIFLENSLMKIRVEAESRIFDIQKLGFVIIKSQSSMSGKLFGSIGTRDIAYAVTKSGVKISKHNVFLPGGKNIRALGDYDVVIKLYHKISTTLNIRVVRTE